MQQLTFLRQNARWLVVPGLMTFGSGFGQTFFISLYAGEIRAEYALSHSAWSAYYASGTLASALLMIVVGAAADRLPARRITGFVITAFILLCIAMAQLPGVWALPVVIFGLRFCGQGMMSMLSMVFAGRWFVASRGKVVALASGGFSLAESLLPVLFVFLMGAIGWRASWLVAAAMLVVLGAVLWPLMQRERQPQANTGGKVLRQTGMNDAHWTRRMMLGNWVFWVAFPALLIQPMIGTTLFFQQVHMVDVKGWVLQDYAALIPIYSITGLATIFAAGALADKIGVSRLLPFYLLPLVACLVILSGANTLGQATLALIFLGVMQGAGGAISGLFWPEYYGTRNLGAIRSVATAAMVFASALGPLASGIGLDAGITYDTQLLIMAAMTLIGAGLLGIVVLGTARARA
jgi:MFS family permease